MRKKKFILRYDWMFRRMIANISNDVARNTFKKWWKHLGKLLDEEVN